MRYGLNPLTYPGSGFVHIFYPDTTYLLLIFVYIIAKFMSILHRHSLILKHLLSGKHEDKPKLNETSKLSSFYQLELGKRKML